MTTDEIAVALHSSPTGGATAFCIIRCKTHKYTKPASCPWEHLKKGFKEESRKVFEIKTQKNILKCPCCFTPTFAMLHIQLVSCLSKIN